MAMLTHSIAQAQEVASSPLGCAIAWRPAGETERGKAISQRKTFIGVVVFKTSTRTRGRRRYLEKAAQFSRIVSWSVEPEL
jgi:hypothetical protein